MDASQIPQTGVEKEDARSGYPVLLTLGSQIDLCKLAARSNYLVVE